MRVAIITESYAPEINGVANSVSRIAHHLRSRGHQPLVITPNPRMNLRQQIIGDPFPVVRLPSLPTPGYSSVRLALPTRLIRQELRRHRPDVVHLASPFVLGAWGSAAAAELGVPIVAVYQTDVPGYAGAYGVGLAARAAWRWTKHIHDRAQLTLAPSHATATKLADHGIGNVTQWGRGVDVAQFHPRHRDPQLRLQLAPDGQLIVGYVGRLAHEKQVELLSEVARQPGVRVVVVGDGPTRRRAAAAMPEALFLGPLRGHELSRIYASLDLFVHTGPHETFCQTIQEAQASGVPVIAPAAGGPIDLIEHEVTGLLVTPSDAGALAAAVLRLRRDPAQRRALGQAGRRAVRDRTWAALGDQLIGHYHAAAAMPPASPALELVA